jgi:hypothetical protein
MIIFDEASNLSDEVWADISWSRCDECGRYISLRDYDIGGATRKLITPSSEFTDEEYETLCPKHS